MSIGFVSLCSSFGRVAMTSDCSTVSALKDMQGVRGICSVQTFLSDDGKSLMQK